MLCYAEINYYEFRDEKNLKFNACEEWERPSSESYLVNEVYHRPLTRELFGYFTAFTEEGAKLNALLSFASWLKNHIITIDTTIGHLEESVKEIEEGNVEKPYRVNYRKTLYGWRWETEKLNGLESKFGNSEVYADSGTVYVKAVSETEAIKLAKKKVYEEVYKQKNAFDPLLNSCAEAFGE